jgi:type 1 glutamine amidotransferase
MSSRSYSFEEMQKLAAECARGYGPAGVHEPTGDYFGVREEEREVFKFMEAAANMTLTKHRRLRPAVLR